MKIIHPHKHAVAYWFVFLEGLILCVLAVVLCFKSLWGSGDKVDDFSNETGKNYSVVAGNGIDNLTESLTGDEVNSDTQVTDPDFASANISGEILEAEGEGSIVAVDTTSELVPMGGVVNPLAQSEAYLRLKQTVEAKLFSMSIEEKIAQLFLVTPETLTLTSGVIIAGNITKNAINEFPVGGLLYSVKNYQNDSQANDLITGVNQFTRDRIGLDMWFFVLGVGSTAATSADNPIFLNSTEDHDMMVAVMSGINTDGLMDTAYLQRVPFVPRDENSFNPDSTCIILEAKSESDITGDDTPCFMSASAVDYVRYQLDYDNVIISDAITSTNIPSGMSPSELAVACLNAGVDMLYVPTDFNSVYDGVYNAVLSGQVSSERLDEAVSNILMCKMNIEE